MLCQLRSYGCVRSIVLAYHQKTCGIAVDSVYYAGPLNTIYT